MHFSTLMVENKGAELKRLLSSQRLRSIQLEDGEICDGDNCVHWNMGRSSQELNCLYKEPCS